MSCSQLSLIQASLEDSKASNITVLDVANATAITDHMIIVTGNSTRHIQAIANQLIQNLKSHDHRSVSHEGTRQDDWILVDCGDVVVHIMHPQTRDFYNLESLWDTFNMEHPTSLAS